MQGRVRDRLDCYRPTFESIVEGAVWREPAWAVLRVPGPDRTGSRRVTCERCRQGSSTCNAKLRLSWFPGGRRELALASTAHVAVSTASRTHRLMRAELPAGTLDEDVRQGVPDHQVFTRYVSESKSDI